MKRWFVFIIGLLLIGYIWGNPFSEGFSTVQAKVVGTAAKEADFISIERLKRLFFFEEAVKEAYQMQVPKGKQVVEKNIPLTLKQAIVATEDKRFYDHHGIDVFGVARAFYINTVAGETMEGGSTISQQLVKNLFLSDERVFSRKVEEAVMALLLERYFTKDEILTMYLNSIYFGNNYTGLYEASRGYFKTDPSRLTLAESALLAGLPQAPSYYNPVENPKGARERRATVLSLLQEQGFISKEEERRANAESLLGLYEKER